MQEHQVFLVLTVIQVFKDRQALKVLLDQQDL